MNQPNISTYPQGTTLTVGSHQVQIIKYLTAGGFAQIYQTTISPIDPFSGTNIACLKRVIVPDKPSLNVLRAEVDAMKLLRNNRCVVSYIDSHAAKSSFQNGTYEVFLLMEYCENGGLINFLNSRLQNRLKESEVVNIMWSVSQGVAAMHALQPPLVHRDIKIENVLLSKNNEFKLCDFGSVSGPIRPPSNPQELALVQNDIMRNTTAQYRSPEMIDMSRGFPIDEKSDIWALGVFLYKICYYTTPFEKSGEAGILTSRYEFPAFPAYSDRLRHLISKLLAVQPNHRPNIYDVVKELSDMKNISCPIINFYLKPNMTDASNNIQHLHSIMNNTNTSTVQIQQQQLQLQLRQQQQVKVCRQQTPSQIEAPQLYMVTGSGDPLSNESLEGADMPVLSRSRSSGALKPMALNSHRKYYEHNLNNQPQTPALPEKSQRQVLNKPIVLEDIDLSSSSEDDDTEGSSIDDNIINSINLPPNANKRLGGRRSVSIFNPKNDTDLKHITKANEKSKESSGPKKVFSKEEVRKRMMEKLKEKDKGKNTTEPVSRSISTTPRKAPKGPPVPHKPDRLRPVLPSKPAFLSGKRVQDISDAINSK
ncbi:serine/threonine protein kinase ARK1 KNAG_0H02020 [Huiozyma naganishii CBS 8797]|uniref:non-specific serine/threonine protein kinase n=1 Tax=Huiozyma naganishii (strain ATCC MYA-139 / BCRC 22969 / CBS 8797 / KCTC 17520 / NBRC 10181 / NCYC 3082 / Yp74L-3) TaxID=1071383 RepID=J7S9P0_HUIN7|nr:hypothetical protein KNAG_0H02020 [Kazachstania naganishii CBS 8797]CCK71616.1 hypothetical protein KNAG_0H02020 [Kazachstania naganishii CBS 8797]